MCLRVYVHAHMCTHTLTDCVQYLIWPLLWAFSPRPQFISNWPQQPHSLNINRLLVNNWLMIWGDLQQHSDNKGAWMRGRRGRINATRSKGPVTWHARTPPTHTHRQDHSLTYNFINSLVKCRHFFSKCKNTVGYPIILTPFWPLKSVLTYNLIWN